MHFRVSEVGHRTARGSAGCWRQLRTERSREGGKAKRAPLKMQIQRTRISYLTGACQSPEQLARLQEAFKKKGKKLNMGKSCVRFIKLEDLPLDVIGKFVKSTPLKKFIEQ